MSYTLVEVDELTQTLSPAALDKLLIKTADGLDKYALIGHVLSITTAEPYQTFTGGTSAVLTLTTMTINPGTDSVRVNFNGADITDFTETDATTITLGFNPISSDVIRVSSRWTYS